MRQCAVFGLPFLFFSLLSFAPRSGALQGQPALPVIVQITTQPLAPPIPSDFLGLSYEAPALTSPYFQKTNTVYVQLLRNLGPGSFRFGGNSVEFTYWLKAPTPADQIGNRKQPVVAITQEDLRRVFDFARFVGWHVILGVNLGHFNPQMAADEAHYAVQEGGATLTAIEIGNEPDLYGENGLRPKGWNFDAYNSQVTAYIHAIKAAAPRAPIAAPAFCCSEGYRWFPQFLANQASQLKLATFHLYPLFHSLPRNLNPTAQQLLSLSVEKREDTMLQTLVTDMAPYSLALRMAETNSVAGGGMPGVSDTYASALWVADYLFRVAEHGLVGVNLHGGFFKGGYSPIWEQKGVFSAAPEYYGILLFHLAAHGQPVQVETKEDNNLRFVAHAVRAPGRGLYVALINKDFQNEARVTVQVPNGYRSGEMIRLQGPAINAQEGITLGESSVDAAGHWRPKEWQSVRLKGQLAQVSVPALSAMLIVFRP